MQRDAETARSGRDDGHRTSGDPLGLGRQPAWMLWTIVAFAATVFHVLIDAHLGLFGEISPDMSVVKGLWGLSESILLGWWVLVTVTAATGHGPSLKSSLVLTGLLALTFNGLVAVVAAPPVSDAAPWQDLAHLSAIAGGFLALRAGIREFRARGSPAGGPLLAVSIALLLINMGVTAPLNLRAMSS